MFATIIALELATGSVLFSAILATLLALALVYLFSNGR